MIFDERVRAGRFGTLGENGSNADLRDESDVPGRSSDFSSISSISCSNFDLSGMCKYYLVDAWCVAILDYVRRSRCVVPPEFVH